MWGISKKDFQDMRSGISRALSSILGTLLRLSEQVRRIEWDIVKLNKKLAAIEARLSGAATQFNLTQQGERMGAITGTAIGGTSVFAAAPLQADGVTAGTLQAGNIPQWSSTDSNVTITPSADGSQATVALAAAETNATYPLTVSGINSDGNAISTTFSVNVLPAVVVPPPPPPDTAATQFGLSQLS